MQASFSFLPLQHAMTSAWPATVMHMYAAVYHGKASRVHVNDAATTQGGASPSELPSQDASSAPVKLLLHKSPTQRQGSSPMTAVSTTPFPFLNLFVLLFFAFPFPPSSAVPTRPLELGVICATSRLPVKMPLHEPDVRLVHPWHGSYLHVYPSRARQSASLPIFA